MCSHYEAPSPSRILETFGVAPQGQYKLDLWPGYSAPFIRTPVATDDDADSAEAIVGVFGLLPHWAKDAKLARRTFNARSETASELPSFRSAWSKARHVIVPAVAIYEPDWRSGKAVATRIARKDGQLLGIAGLWEEKRDAEGAVIHSFTMLTVNADAHPLMSQFHKPGDEKRMVVILPAGAYRDWLKATPEQSMDLLGQYPADRLVAEARPAG